MARTNIVKAFRGQRQCQYSAEGSWNTCDLERSAHEGLDHEFTQKPLRCEACGNPIEIGMSYKWVAPRAHRGATGHKRNRHVNCPAWKQSELTSSQHLATIYAAQEGAEDALASVTIDTVEDAEGVLETLREIAGDFADQVREASQSYEESAQNIEDGFGHETYQSEELREKSESIEGWADEAADVSLTDFDENDNLCSECSMVLEDEQHTDEKNEDYHEFVSDDDVLQDWLQEQIDAVTDVINDNPL